MICFLIVVPIIVYTQDIGQKVLGFFTSAAAAF
ncbi:MAG: hypothetical protein JNL07_04825 [Rhodospirillales bacterium]|nr:hypothetical protein [Rhodospirillales bacterium]